MLGTCPCAHIRSRPGNEVHGSEAGCEVSSVRGLAICKDWWCNKALNWNWVIKRDLPWSFGVHLKIVRCFGATTGEYYHLWLLRPKNFGNGREDFCHPVGGWQLDFVTLGLPYSQVPHSQIQPTANQKHSGKKCRVVCYRYHVGRPMTLASVLNM